MQIGPIESFMNFGKEQLVQGQIKDEKGNSDFHNVLTRLTSGNGQDVVETSDLEEAKWKTTSFVKDFLPSVGPLLTDEDALLTDQEDLNSISIEDIKTVLKNLISALSSEMDEDDQVKLTELQSFVKDMNEENLDWSLIGVFNVLNQLMSSFPSTEKFKANVVPLLKMAGQMIRYQTMEQKQLDPESFRVLETFIQKNGFDLDLQSVYSRWNGGDGTKERNIVFPFPLGQDRFQVAQIKNYVANHSNQDGISKQGLAGGQDQIKLNTSPPLPQQNDDSQFLNEKNEKNTDFFQISQQLGRSGKGKTDEPILNRMASSVTTFEGEEKILNDKKAEGSFSVVNKIQSLQQTGHPETLKLIDRDQQPVSYKQFEKEFASILSRGNFIKNGNVQRLTVKLHPEHLGELKIELVQKQGEIIAKIISSTDRAKELLETQLSSLRHAFVQQNINVTRIDMQTEGAFDGFEDQEQSFYGSGGYSNDRNEDGEKNEDSKEMTFQEALFNMEI
ncbi:flagellar hook-length control protein FliK [Fervidibacillus halotolerans]|uniref:Flagellar hook-length control protein FliK n=1 Tax=Fervidibacillus halotolerans TaxID=2980027 RepID=A0A9E8M2X0_9BACI|nr:flagellar hook-length control protein FliK [Fervidibacillus halotolerans]WAA13601.1 flagellar hook-length control protein FliK [Fervidibacillus halotolerans]